MHGKGDAFWRNIVWNFEQVVVQHAHAAGVNTRARSGYYKAAIILASSVAEALAYRILEERLHGDVAADLLLEEDWQYFDCHNIPPQYGRDGMLLSLCQRRKQQFILTKQTDFKKVNEMCLRTGCFTKHFFKRVEMVRTRRNQIHIQGLKSLGRSWNKAQLDQVARVVTKLIRMTR